MALVDVGQGSDSGLFGTGVSSNAVGGAFSDFGTAISDFSAAKGYKLEAQTYGQAADLENQNATLAAASGVIQSAQMQRKVYQSLSGTQAEIAGAGLAAKGSAGDIMRSSAQQGSLTQQLVAAQTEINVNAYKAQAGAYSGQEAMAKQQAKSSTEGGWMSAIEGVAALAIL